VPPLAGMVAVRRLNGRWERFKRRLARRAAPERTFRGLKPTAKVSRRYRGESLIAPESSRLICRAIEDPLYCRRDEAETAFARCKSLKLAVRVKEIVCRHIPVVVLKRIA